MTCLGQIFHSRVLEKYGPRMDVNFEKYYLARTSSPLGYFTQDNASLYTDNMARNGGQKLYLESDARIHVARSRPFGLLEKMLYVDTKTWLPDDLLIKAHRMTMANSVELRVPFLDHKVLEFAARINEKPKGTRLDNEVIWQKKRSADMCQMKSLR